MNKHSDRILVSSGCKLDGLGYVAAANYVCKNLLDKYHVTLLICLDNPRRAYGPNEENTRQMIIDYIIDSIESII